MYKIEPLKKNIVMISTTNWNSKLWFRRQHFAHRFARSGWKVLYVNPSFTFMRPFHKNKTQGLKPSMLFSFLADRQIDNNLKVITLPPGIPFEGRIPMIKNIDKKISGFYIEQKARQFFKNEPYVLICYNPFDVYLSMKNSSLLIYECVDDYTGDPGFFHIRNEVCAAESLLMKKADIVTATASSLREKKQRWNNNITIVPNGVDFSQFQNIISENTIPADIAHIKPPVVMYIGAIYDWFNFPLVKKICDTHPEWSVVLIGPDKILSKQIMPKNLYYLGTKDWKELPGYLKAADVGIIPFIENEYIQNINPLKLYDYFAAGLSCVSSFMYEIKKYEEPYILEIAQNDDDFIKAIERNIGKKEMKLNKKISIAKRHSWDNIFLTFKDLIVSR